MAEQAPPVFDERIALGLPSLAGYALPAALQKARELGFQSVMSLPGGPRTQHSLGPFPTLRWYEAPTEREGLRGLLKPFRHVAIHQAWNDDWESWLECAAFVGAKVVTVHSPTMPSQPTEAQWQQHLDHFRRIGDEAQRRGLRIGIENVGGSCDQFVRFVREVKHAAVGATLDTGHCAYFAEVKQVQGVEKRIEALNDTIERLARELGAKLFSLHVHNVRSSDWRDHRSVPDGVVDFPRLFRALRAAGYQGLFELELEEADRERAAAASGAFVQKIGTATILFGTIFDREACGKFWPSSLSARQKIIQ